MARLLKVLIIDDSDDDATLVFRLLRKEYYEPFSERVETAEELASALRRHKWDIVLCDYKMPVLDSLKALELVKGYNPDMPFVLISGFANDQMAEEIIKAGADNYITKNDFTGLIPTIEKELIKAKIRVEKRLQEQANVKI